VRDAAEYLSHIRALIALMPQIVHCQVLREEAQGDTGLFRYRLSLRDDSSLEVFELFQVVDGEIKIRKYSFHWQDSQSGLIKRWDNAAHHPEVITYPHHVHKGAESNVLPHQSVDIEVILSIVNSNSDVDA